MPLKHIPFDLKTILITALSLLNVIAVIGGFTLRHFYNETMSFREETENSIKKLENSLYLSDLESEKRFVTYTVFHEYKERQSELFQHIENELFRHINRQSD
ncbi:hypothetical protein CI610_01374 [invertebrate metagenome]|uniref:Uncharacterized protein n=1 Tax=invertebrate metagenome TaxID=1711999 RepID=A0A2H9T8V9_9ZZZZ